MRTLITWLTLFVLITSCTRKKEGNILYLGPISADELSIRKIVSDNKAGKLDAFAYDWKLPNGKTFSWKRGMYQIDIAKGNEQMIYFPEIGSLNKGDAMVFHMKMNNNMQNHLRFIGDTKGIINILVDGKEIIGDHCIIPAGEYDLLLIYVHKNQFSKGVPFTIVSAVNGKLIPELGFKLPEVKGEIELPDYMNGIVEFLVTESEIGNPKPCRIYVNNEKGEPQFDDTCPDCFETFTCDGEAKLFLPSGKYTYKIESGKEYLNIEGEFEISTKETIHIKKQLSRFCDLNSEGWYAGDLHNHTTIEDTPLLMESENIHISYVPWWWINPPMGRSSEKSLLEYPPLIKLGNNRYIDTRVGEDERWDATLMFFRLPENIDIPNASWSSPPSVHFAKKFGAIKNVWIHLDHMFWWQTPAILASGELNSIEVLNNNFVYGGVNDNEAWGRPRDMVKYPPPYGNAKYQQDVYFRILNSGFRIPPAAGSAACIGGGPFGYNRVYVHVDGELTYEKWWRALEEGKCFITNGPLLRVKANGELPGHVFKSDVSVSISTDLKIDTRENITDIQVIKNGDVVNSISYIDFKKGKKLPIVKFERSGWFLIRILTDNTGTYRTALSGPYYVEIGSEKSFINKMDVKFFLDWTREAAKQNIAPTKEGRELFDRYAVESIRFWEKLYLNAREF